MIIILFAHIGSGQKGQRLKTIIDQSFQHVDRQCFDDLNGLKLRLRQIPDFYQKEIFVLLADTPERLWDLNEFRDELEGRDIILVLPDDSKQTLVRVYPFSPRYFTYHSDTYEDLCGVLAQMLKRHEKLKLIYHNLQGN